MNTVPTGGTHVETFFMYLRKVKIVFSIIAVIANESGIKASSVAKRRNHLTRSILSKDNTMESGGGLSRFHIAVGEESGELS
jgi:hypothetical protein